MTCENCVALLEELQQTRAVVLAARALVQSTEQANTLIVDTATGNIYPDLLTNLRRALDHSPAVGEQQDRL